ncbi:hypothetical protein QJS10_CPB17g01652 [Acorus calamus]|uniref:DUF3741 domain-containing protein n=1 Tax=Acorus calamus TaxID=4465 RepID=A0AAV9CUR0_ACOCL|nr:hypothetical protein QJS10_CPB17g01652 [Acorus calamus]
MSSPGGGTIRRRVVARLMGLEDGDPSPPVEKVAEEKRRRLLGALERCEEDVRALKRIIEAVHVAEEQQRRAEEVVDGRGKKAGDLDGGDVKVVTPSKELDGRDLSVIKEVPSPVSVLDVVYSPFNLGSSSIKLKKGNHQRKNHQPPKKKNETSDEGFIYRRFSAPTAGDDLFGRTGPDVGMVRAARRRLRWSGGSPAMEECVEEVGRDMEWEERWELRRVVVVLEGHILGGLVDEIVREMGFCYQRFSFGFGKCRKRLVF